MSLYQFSRATAYNHVQLSEMNNQSFEGYLFPATMTPEISANFWRQFQIDQNRSIVMHDQNGTFVGLARLAIRGRRAWCGGFAIVPQFRGTGAAQALIEQMIQVARENNLISIQLEVLTQNTRAVKLYERAGFVTTRRLLGLEIVSSVLPPDNSLTIEQVEIESIISLLAQRERPYWGLELPSLLTAQTETIVATDRNGQKNVMVIQRQDESVRIWAAVLMPSLTNAELAALLRAVAGSAKKIQILNEPEHNAYSQRYLAIGFNEFFHQYEMFYKL